MSGLGLIAGEGELPLLVARSAADAGLRIIAVALSPSVTPGLSAFADRVYRIGPDRPEDIVGVLSSEGVDQAVMAGKVWKERMFEDGAIRAGVDLCMGDNPARNDDAILRAFVERLEGAGINVREQTEFLGQAIARTGLLASREPDAREWGDILFGFQVAKYIAGADIGQTVVVKNRVVLAVEALEGTDAAILRGGRLGREGAVVVKVSKPAQDMRFDVPTIGKETLRTMHSVGATVLGVEAGKTFIVDIDGVSRLADQMGISIVGL
ncbi:MAG TPA: LpxI family protein [Firmicutes bacterium]|nr:LpxI family protein [Bacillota bacterium]